MNGSVESDGKIIKQQVGLGSWRVEKKIRLISLPIHKLFRSHKRNLTILFLPTLRSTRWTVKCSDGENEQEKKMWISSIFMSFNWKVSHASQVQVASSPQRSKSSIVCIQTFRTSGLQRLHVLYSNVEKIYARTQWLIQLKFPCAIVGGSIECK